MRQQEAAQTRTSRGNAGKNGGREEAEAVEEFVQKRTGNVSGREEGAFLVEGADGE